VTVSTKNDELPRTANAKQRPRRGRGHPRYVATPEARKVVELMAAHGIAQVEIGRAIVPPCSVPTLRMAFAEELSRARPRYKGLVAQSMHLHLMGRPAEYSPQGKLIRRELEPNVTMAIFQAKVVLGLRERLKLDAGPLITEDMLIGLDETEIDTLVALIEKMSAAVHEEAAYAEDPEARRYGSLHKYRED
jgi:hypothetical protein